MAKLDFSNSLFARDLRANIWDAAARFYFETEAEFDIVANIMHDICKQYTLSQKFPEVPNTVNAALQENIKQIIELLAEPENYISLNYVKQNPQKFIKITPHTPTTEQHEQDITALRASLTDLTEEDVKQAYLALAFQEISDRATYFNKLESALRSDRIKSRVDLTQRARDNNTSMQKAVPPTVGSEASTYTSELARMFGGSAQYQEVIEHLSDAQGISNCVDIQGMIDGTYTDQDGIKWSFTIARANTRRNELQLIFKNDQPIYPIPEQPEAVVETEQVALSFSLPHFSFGEGNFRVKSTTISDIVHNLIRCRTEIAYACGFALASHKESAFDSLLNSFMQQNALRANMISQIREHQPRETLPEHEMLAQLFRTPLQLIAHPETSSSLNNMTLLFRFPSIQRINEFNESESSDDDLEVENAANSSSNIDEDSNPAAPLNNENDDHSYTRDNPRRSTRRRRQPDRYA